MSEDVLRCKTYVAEVLTKKNELINYIDESTILLNNYDGYNIWDLLILLDDNLFKYEFAHLYSKTFTVDDHEHKPAVFTRIKCYQWLKDDLLIGNTSNAPLA